MNLNMILEYPQHLPSFSNNSMKYSAELKDFILQFQTNLHENTASLLITEKLNLYPHFSYTSLLKKITKVFKAFATEIKE